MITLRQAMEQGELDKFIAEHGGEIGEMDAFNPAGRHCR